MMMSLLLRNNNDIIIHSEGQLLVSAVYSEIMHLSSQDQLVTHWWSTSLDQRGISC